MVCPPPISMTAACSYCPLNIDLDGDNNADIDDFTIVLL
jgi:hypothetical protein